MITILRRFTSWLRRSAPPTPGIDNHYFRLATQYYVAARAAVFLGSDTVAGNLFHLAVEFYLKGDLSTHLSRRQLKRLGHHLRGIWRAYRRKYPSPTLATFDTTIRDLDRFEAIRYPDVIVAKGMFYSISVTRPYPPPAFKVASAQTPPTFALVVNEVDNLVRTIFTQASINPDFYLNRLGREGLAALRRDNPAF